MKKFVNELEIVENGIIHISDNAEFKINIGGNLVLRVAFLTDEKDKSRHIDSVFNNTNDLTIQCYNFKNSLGEGILTPTKLGTLDNKELFFSFFVWTPDTQKEQRIISYNVLVK